MNMEPSTFLLMILLLFIVPVGFALFYFRDLVFTPAIRGNWFSYRLNEKRNDEKVGELNGIDFADHAEKEMYGVSGEANPEVFSPLTIEAYRKAHKRGVKITVLAGPVLLAHPAQRTCLLLHLAQEGVIDLYVSPRRRERHFWVSSNGQVYYEIHHEPGANERTAVEFKYNKFESKWFMRKFRKILEGADVRKYDSSKENFILLYQETLEQLKNRLREKPKRFDNYTYEELKKELSQSEIPYSIV
jgi:hypothetical protein